MDKVEVSSGALRTVQFLVAGVTVVYIMYLIRKERRLAREQKESQGGVGLPIGV